MNITWRGIVFLFKSIAKLAEIINAMLTNYLGKNNLSIYI